MLDVDLLWGLVFPKLSLDPPALWKEDDLGGVTGAAEPATEFEQDSRNSCSEGGSGNGMFSNDFHISFTKFGRMTSSSAATFLLTGALMSSKLFLIFPISFDGLSTSPAAASLSSTLTFSTWPALFFTTLWMTVLPELWKNDPLNVWNVFLDSPYTFRALWALKSRQLALQPPPDLLDPRLVLRFLRAARPVVDCLSNLGKSFTLSPKYKFNLFILLVAIT